MTERLVLVVEDDRDWQKSLDELVRDAGFIPVVTSTYSEATAALSKQSFVLAVVDISLAFDDHLHRGGVDVLREIFNLPAKLPAIVVTGYATTELAIETLADLGAEYFFRKAKLDRRKFINIVKEKAVEPNLLDVLSRRERQVLVLMGQGKTNPQIADELVVSVNTIKKHVQSIFTKLNVNSRAAAVAKAHGQDID